MNNNDVIHLLEKSSTKADTAFSKNIFDLYEEGKEDTDIIAGRLNKNRRDWLILADLYNDQKYTQKFHLLMYLKFKYKNSKIKLEEPFKYPYIANAALRLYIGEVIEERDMADYYTKVERFYKNKGSINKAPRR
ncbi:hypothetical protein GYN67_02470 [Lactococcus piscium]|uniref:hypothetical protein n=1 Tax=Pseudolactococcus carnosus TaxID=2749961 RepID=UPI001FBA8F28|nr:hypothetical protein [Lactococcus carnosus]MCJ1995558.1 hypothetical protein [Lactococcus carnosus]